MFNEKSKEYSAGDDISIYMPLTKGKDRKDGARIIYGIASDETVDMDGQVVKASGIKDSLDYFLKHGAIDFDHRAHHFDKDPKYLVGEPIDGKVEGNKFYLKAKLYKGMPIADTVWGLINNGAKMGFSVGGKILKMTTEFDKSLGKDVPKIDKVLLTHVAVTKHPVNPATEMAMTDSWKMFAKSMSKNPDGTTDVVKAIEEHYKAEEARKKSQDDNLEVAMKTMIKGIIEKSMDTANSAAIMKQSLEKDTPKVANQIFKRFKKRLKEMTKSRIESVLDQYYFIKGKK